MRTQATLEAHELNQTAILVRLGLTGKNDIHFSRFITQPGDGIRHDLRPRGP
ncbi:MAG TPA: hypothetical protein VFB76_01245 [Candidatus Angelobacter sp.]|nr:hypothetical protein [Candidatus Angelobacter sp.]